MAKTFALAIINTKDEGRDVPEALHGLARTLKQTDLATVPAPLRARLLSTCLSILSSLSLPSSSAPPSPSPSAPSYAIPLADVQRATHATTLMCRCVGVEGGGDPVRDVMGKGVLARMHALVALASSELKRIDEQGGKVADAPQEENLYIRELARMRLEIFTTLGLVAISESRCVALADADITDLCISAMLSCPSSKFDMEGMKTACDLLRKLALPSHLTAPSFLSAGAAGPILRAAAGGCRDPTGAAAAAAALRNILRGEKSGKFAAELCSLEYVETVLAMDLTKTHPFARVELCRVFASALPTVVAFLRGGAGAAGGGGTGTDTGAGTSTGIGAGAGASAASGGKGKKKKKKKNKKKKKSHTPETSTPTTTTTTTTPTTTTTTTPTSTSPACPAPQPSPSQQEAHPLQDTALLAGLALLGTKAGVESICFLLASQQPSLHHECALGLSALRSLSKLPKNLNGGGECVVECDPLEVAALVLEVTPVRDRLVELTQTTCADSLKDLLKGA